MDSKLPELVITPEEWVTLKDQGFFPMNEYNIIIKSSHSSYWNSFNR